MRTTAGCVRADIRFSKRLAWHNFPLPDVGSDRRAQAIAAGAGVLAARSRFPERSLADLYDPRAMPTVLVDAHRALDRVIDPCFAGRRRIRTEADRQVLLFERYQELEREQMLVTNNTRCATVGSPGRPTSSLPGAAVQLPPGDTILAYACHSA